MGCWRAGLEATALINGYVHQDRSFVHFLEQLAVLHCTVAWRASHLWAAYLVAHHDVSVPQAVAVGKAMNMGGFPFAEFLGRTVTLEGDKTPRSKETEMAVEVEGEAEQR